MTLNIGIDLLVGALPGVCNYFDIYWRANKKKFQLLRRHFQDNPMPERSLKRFEGPFVAGMIALMAMLLSSVLGAYFILTGLFSLLPQRTH